MSSSVTMVFIDLAGSTAAYAALGNAQVADVIAKVTQWIGRVCEAHGGRTVKFLGDGVLAQFPHGADAVEAAVFMQLNHSERLEKWPEPLRMGLKIGMARGSVVQMADDVYGDPVNLAARLSDMAGAQTIWSDESVIVQLREGREPSSRETHVDGDRAAIEGARYRSLGVEIRAFCSGSPNAAAYDSIFASLAHPNDTTWQQQAEQQRTQREAHNAEVTAQQQAQQQQQGANNQQQQQEQPSERRRRNRDPGRDHD